MRNGKSKTEENSRNRNIFKLEERKTNKKIFHAGKEKKRRKSHPNWALDQDREIIKENKYTFPSEFMKLLFKNENFIFILIEGFVRKTMF